jgi:hypothetical protein
MSITNNPFSLTEEQLARMPMNRQLWQSISDDSIEMDTKRKEIHTYRSSLPLTKKLLCKLGLHDMKPMGDIWPWRTYHPALLMVLECIRCGKREDR